MTRWGLGIHFYYLFVRGGGGGGGGQLSLFMSAGAYY